MQQILWTLGDDLPPEIMKKAKQAQKGDLGEHLYELSRQCFLLGSVWLHLYIYVLRSEVWGAT